MGKRYLIDTNIAIYFLDGLLPTSAIPFLSSVLNHENNISIISKIELLGWNFPNTESFNFRNNFVHKSHILALSDDIANKTIDIRRLHKIKLRNVGSPS